MKYFISTMILLISLDAYSTVVSCTGSNKDKLEVRLSDNPKESVLIKLNHYSIGRVEFEGEGEMWLQSYTPSRSTRSDSVTYAVETYNSENEMILNYVVFPEDIMERKLSKRKFKVEVISNLLDGNLYERYYSFDQCMVISK